MKKPMRGFLVWALIMVALVTLSQLFSSANAPDNTDIKYDQLLELVSEQQIQRIAIVETTLVGLRKNSAIPVSEFPNTRYDFKCVIDRDNFFDSVKQIRARQLGTSPDLISEQDLGFAVDYLLPAVLPWYLEFLPYIIVMVLMAVFWMFIMRQQQGGSSKMMSFGKTKARVADPASNKIRFGDVAGANEEKEELEEIVEFLKNPRRFTDVGARIPKGVLLIGPPGTGKTLLAKAVAGEAGVPFFSISGSDFLEMFVGVGASRVRDLFDQAKRHAPSIVFIDEIDAVGRHRGAGLGGGHDEREQTLNQLLVEMDGFLPNEGVIVLAATNRRDILDPALLRPGRFDRQVTINYPDVQGRIDILKIHSKGKPLDEDVDFSLVARRTPMFTGADLENVMNEAAILTARAKEKKITMRLIDEAITRVEVGLEKKSKKISARDRRITAIHEAGHAIVGMFTDEADPVQSVTIVPRGDSGGHTRMMPDEERSHVTRKQLVARIKTGMGGRAAEQIEFGDVTTGAVADIQSSTALARRMVTQFGMSDELGPVYLGGEQEVFLGRDFTSSKSTSEVIAAKIDNAIHDLIGSCEKAAQEVIRTNYDKLKQLAELLLERETVDKDALDAIRDGSAVPPPRPIEVKPRETASPQIEIAVQPALYKN